MSNNKYLHNLISSRIHVDVETFSKFQITDSGLYILCTNFDLEKITGHRYLKVGMTAAKKGLKDRLGQHFSSNIRATILAKHMFDDDTLSQNFGLDFKLQKDRKFFFKKYCYFKVLPLKDFNWKNKEDKKIKSRELKKIESSEIESPISDLVRYIGLVKKR